MRYIMGFIFAMVMAYGCVSDFDCGFGEVCVKKPYTSNGVCMKEVDEYGVQQFNSPRLDSVMPRMNDDGCDFDTDCPIGFRCDNNYKVCVKR